MLNWTERIIRMRKEVPEIGWGDFEVIDTPDRAVLILRYNWRNNSALIPLAGGPALKNLSRPKVEWGLICSLRLTPAARP